MATVCVPIAHNIYSIKFLRCMQKWLQLILEAGAVTSSKNAGRSLPKLKARRQERGKTLGQWRCHVVQPSAILKLRWKAGLWRWLGEDHPRYFELFRDGLMKGEILQAIALGVLKETISQHTYWFWWELPEVGGQKSGSGETHGWVCTDLPVHCPAKGQYIWLQGQTFNHGSWFN